MSNRRCTKCGKDISTKGYHAHYKYCKGTLEKAGPPAPPEAETVFTQIKSPAEILAAATEILNGGGADPAPIEPQPDPPYIPMSICPKEIELFQEGRLMHLTVGGRRRGDRFVIEPEHIKIR